jgi:hypothetical protein
MSTGSFLQVAAATLNITPEYPVGIAIYSTKKDVALTSLTATAINAEIAADTCIGYLSGWNSIAGANVAEKNIERVATAKMKLVKEEVAADTYTFPDEMYINKILGKKATCNTFNCLVIGNKGGVYGEKTLKAASIGTMEINFSGKTSNGGFQDLTNEKTVAITARYIVKELGYVAAAIETEDIVPKIPLDFTISTVSTHTATSIVAVLNLIDARTNKTLTAFDADPITINAVVNGVVVSAAATFGTNQLTVTLTGTGFTTTADVVSLELSTATHYTDEVPFNIANFI